MMRIGIVANEVGRTFDEVVASLRQAAEYRVRGVWLGQHQSYDPLLLLGIVAREVEPLELGTSVVVTYPRHPVVLAAEALTLQGASGGRLTLGIGTSHKYVIEGMYGRGSFRSPLQHMREYLTILMPLLRGEAVELEGEYLHSHGPIQVPACKPPTVLVAALGEKMLELAGQLADGATTMWTGPRGLETHVVPTITRAAAAHGRPPPRVSASLLVAVTSKPDELREQCSSVFSHVRSTPSYAAALEREQLEGAGDLLVAGDEEAVTRQLELYFESGVSDIKVACLGSVEDQRRTAELMSELSSMA